MEGRVYTDIYRNTSEELFIKNMMESSIGMLASPTMEFLGFKNFSQSFRADSEELFNNWLTPTENNGGIPAHRTRQASRRISAEASNVPNELQSKITEEFLFQQNISMADDSSIEHNQPVTMNNVDKGLQASNLFLAKAWFDNSQPITRSRSSELRRSYVQQNSYTSIGIEAINNMNCVDSNQFKQEQTDRNGFINAPITEFPNHFTSFMSPSNSSSCTLNNIHNISSVVNMLKGTLERKKIYNGVEKEAIEDSPFGYYGHEEMLSATTGLNQVQDNHIYNMQQDNYQSVSHVQVNTEAGSYGIGGTYGVSVTTTNQFQGSRISREPSQSESSFVVSGGFDTCDGSSVSGKTHSVTESSGKQMVNGKSSGNGTRARVEQGDPTKKRRVERSRKMAEAKEKNMTPAVNSDMQSLLKRCENLEKEVRSLKLNLAFMNRKDSEQCKQTEELEKQKEKLSKEKGRLLEEIERIIYATPKM